MALVFERWNIVEPDGRLTAVLVLVEDGERLCEPGLLDCFPQTAEAAEAAWLRDGGPPPRGTWLAAADAVMAAPAAHTLQLTDSPRPRHIDADLIARDEVVWLQDLAGQSLSANRSYDGLPAPLPGPDVLTDFLRDDPTPLSGQTSQEWELADVAGLTTRPPPTPQDALGTVSDGPLSGGSTRDWGLVEIAAVVAGGRSSDGDESGG